MTAKELRIGEAAEALGVQVETVRRWERQGLIKTRRTKGGQRTVPSSEIKRVRATRRPSRARVVGQSVRNRFPGIVTDVKVDGVAATVEIQAGPHRVLALTTREAVEELGLEPGMKAVAAVKATNVFVEVTG
ncbi:MAG: TOBE domain-containing protein [Actinomycetota bacterium]